MRRLIRLASFWAFVVFAALVVLQVSPFPGAYLMFIRGALIAGLALHVFLIALFVEALAGRAPRVLMAIPIAAYGGYYALLGHQASQIAEKSAELRAANAGKVLPFDPNMRSVVTKEASEFVSQHAIAVAYQPASGFKPEGYLAFRLIRRDQCKIPRDSQGRIVTLGVFFGDELQHAVCELRIPEMPEHKPIVATTRGDAEIQKHKWSISEYSTDFAVDGQIVTSYRSASVWQLPRLPKLFIGCGLVSSKPAWECGADFLTTYMTLDVVPAGIDRARYDSPLSVVLGIPKYTAEDLAHFQGFAENDAALARVAEEPQRVEDEVFRVLEDIIAGGNPKPPVNMAHSVAQNPTRLAPLGEGMVKRLAELSEVSPNGVAYRDDQIRALAGGLSALPRDAFARIAGPAFTIIQRTEKPWERMPVLYVRAADVGPESLAFYRRDFMTEKMKGYLKSLPVLAICRIGEADDGVIAEMKARFLAAKFPHDTDQSALLVTLLKLGQESFLREHRDAVLTDLHDWSEVVLGKKGLTQTGPNNCMPQQWPTTDYLSAIMAPGLKWRAGWVARENI